jgi:hypothetical protein
VSAARRSVRTSGVTLLLVCFAAAAFMAGLSWFVGVVHYPLFAGVGADGWASYHRRHSDRTTIVVVVPMLVELVTAGLIALDPPGGVPGGAALAGLALAGATWLLTAEASRIHGTLGAGLDPRPHRRLLAVHHARSVLWSAHAVLVATMIAGATAPA